MNLKKCHYKGYLPGLDVEHYTSCMQQYLLLQYGKTGNESKDVTINTSWAFDISVIMNVYTYIGWDDADFFY